MAVLRWLRTKPSSESSLIATVTLGSISAPSGYWMRSTISRCSSPAMAGLTSTLAIVGVSVPWTVTVALTVLSALKCATWIP